MLIDNYLEKNAKRLKDKKTYGDSEFEINHVFYEGGYDGDDVVCQVKRHGRQVGHCTWHPTQLNQDNACPYKGGAHCRLTKN
jgi:hypothetical protein